MKKFLFSLMAIVLVSVNVNAQKDYNKIVKDTTFKEWYLDFIKETKRNIDLETLRGYASDGKIDDLELRKGYRAFGYSSYSELEYQYTLQNNRLKVLNDRFNLAHFDENEMFGLLDLADQNYGGLYNTTEGNCADRYRYCKGKVTTLAVLAHAACLVADTTVIGGIICHAAASSGHAFGMQDCKNDYNDCMQ